MANNLYPRILALIGLLLSGYALYVEHMTSGSHGEAAGDAGTSEGVEDIFAPVEDSEFKALCDIEEIGASCSEVFNLPQGRMLSYFGIVPDGSALDVPNALLGLLYYSFMFFRGQFLPNTHGMNKFTLVACVPAMTSSVWLGTELIKLKELCVLCISTHIINTLLLVHYSKKVMSGGSTKSKQA